MATIAETGKIVAVEGTPRPPFARALARSWVGRTALLLLGSTVVGVIFALPLWGEMSWKESMPQWWAWGLIAPLIVWADGALPFPGRQFGRRAVAHIPGSVIFTALYLYV